MDLHQGIVLKLRMFVLLSVGLMAGAMGPVAAEDHTYVLNTSTGKPYTSPEDTGFQDRIVAELFRRLGLKGEVEYYGASARALINANEGVDDGVAMRIRDLNKRFPNMVRVDEILIQNDFVAYSRHSASNLKIETWDDLKGLSVGYINGWVIFENNVPDTSEHQKVKLPKQMFEMLARRRIDVALYERWQGLQAAHDTGLKVTTHEPPLASVPMYMHVHKKHADLAPKMAAVLREMKQDGTYDKIFEKTLMPLSAPQLVEK